MATTEKKQDGSGITWGRVLVRDAHGAADLEATLRMLEVEGRTYIANNEIPLEQIKEAVASVFEQNPKTQFDLGSLTNRTLMAMNVAAGSETKVGELIKGFVRAESKAFEADRSGLYHVSRGKNGGCRRVSAEYTAAYNKAQAAKAAAAE